jgi:predicted acetyltransferase
MITLPGPPSLVRPTTTVCVSYLTGEQADCLLEGTSTDWLGPASQDFGAYVAERCGVRMRWDVPSTIFWYAAGEHYLGTLVLRHELTPALAEAGGHIGYHVVAPWRRQGHATRMLSLGLTECLALGLERVLLTCNPDNEPSRRMILANGGVAADRTDGEDHFWISLGSKRSSAQ